MQVAQLLVERAAYCAEHLLQQLRPLGLAHARLEVAGLVIIPCTAVPQCQAGLFCGNCSVCEPLPAESRGKAARLVHSPQPLQHALTFLETAAVLVDDMTVNEQRGQAGRLDTGEWQLLER